MAAPEVQSSAVSNPPGASVTGTGSPSDFPSSLPLEDLQKNHREFDGELLCEMGDLYEGGKRFYKNIEKYLLRRPVEGSGAPKKSSGLDKEVPGSGDEFGGGGGGGTWEGQRQYENRKKSALYTPHAANLIDHLNSAVHFESPEIDSKDDYLKTLNGNIDGDGTPFSCQSRSVLTDLLVYNRPFLSVFTPPTMAANLAQQRAQGGLDARIGVIHTQCVNDWETAAGKYEWIRTYQCRYVRVSAWQQPTIEEHTWSYVTASGIQRYVARCEIGKLADTKAVPGTFTPHSFKRLPVVPVKIPAGLWAMQRLAAIAKARFNRRSSITWINDLMAFALLVLSTQRSISNISLTDFGALLLDQGDSAQFISPNTQIVNELFRDDDALKGDMYEVLYAMALTAQNQPENARQSGSAKTIDREPLSMILRSCASALTTAYQESLGMVADFRGVDKPSLIGLTHFDSIAMNQVIESAKSLFELPAYPKPAMIWEVYEFARSRCRNASEEVKKAIEDWKTTMLAEAGKLGPENLSNTEVQKSNTKKIDNAA